MNEAETSALALARRQYGLISRPQALAFGCSERVIDRRIANGRWQRSQPNVYRIAGAPVTARQRAMAATLWLGDAAFVSHQTAGALLRLDAIDADAIHVVVPRSVRARIPLEPVVVHRTNVLARADRAVVDGIPCTSATRTIIDLAGVLDDEPLEAAFESARRAGLTSPAFLAQRAADLFARGRSGSTALRRLLERLEPGRALESRLEVRVARLLRASLLPVPARQFRIGRYRVDFAWPERRVALECDGFEAHGNRLQWKRDRRRVATIEAQAWRLVHVTWDDVCREPAKTLARIEFALVEAA
jgi:very-short-patch-repair endonuclease